MNTEPPRTAFSPQTLQRAEANIRDILALALKHGDEKRAIVVWDGECELAIALTEAYRRCLPGAQFIEFHATPPDEVMAAFEGLGAGELVALIQSTSFRLHAFRIRLELFRRGLKVIEHPHLARMPGVQGLTYIDSLAYDQEYYRGVGSALKQRIDNASEAVLEGDGERLVYPAGLEPAKLNVGDYTEMKNTGGQYPIGEVFTESRDLEAVNGRIRIAFFGDTEYRVNKPPIPITLVIEAGRVVDTVDSTPEFDQVLQQIHAGEGQVWLRELGFGMNRALTKDSVVSDIGTFERMCGVHLSLGAKHASYNKPNIRKKAARFHVDVFLITDSVTIDGEVLYHDGAWQVSS
ncbi:MAG: aminopeptidase [Planctomycetota bacterium]|jgi:aminopeptidase